MTLLEKVPQVVSHVPGGRITLGRTLQESFQADTFQLLGNRVVDLAGWASLSPDHLLDDPGKRLRPEWSAPGQQLVEDHAEAEDVRTPIDQVPLASCLLWTHVGRSSSRLPALAEILVSQRETEVGDTRLARSVDQDVGGLDVPVDQPLGVGVMQCFGHGGDEFGRIIETKATVGDLGRQVAAFEELGNDVTESVFRATHIKDRHDVGMVQFGEDSGFNEKQFHVLGVNDAFRVSAP